MKPIERVRELLSSLQIPYCVASSGGHDKMRATLGATGMLVLFEGRIFSAGDVENPKPEPDVFLFAAESMGAEPSRTAVVEDSVSGVLAGRAAGMTVFAHSGHTAAARLEDAGAEATFGHMSELESLLASSPRAIFASARCPR